MRDLEALADEDDRAKARRFVERAGMVACAGLPAAEMLLLTSAVGLTRAEQDLLVGWQDPASWDAEPDEDAGPPGRGNFPIKVGGRPGIPVHVALKRRRTTATASSSSTAPTRAATTSTTCTSGCAKQGGAT